MKRNQEGGDVSGDIKAGDLVMVVKPRLCCPEHSKFSVITTVLEIMGSNRMIRCPYCRKLFHTLAARIDYCDGVIEVSRLKKLPPLTEPESIEVTTQEPVNV